MATSYEVVFNSFLRKIDNDDLFSLDAFEEEEITDTLVSLLDSAIFQFHSSEIDLSDRDETELEFNQTLGASEIEVLAILMRYQWVTNKIADMNLIKQKYTDRDFELTSQAAHLRALIELENTVRKQAKYALNNYNRIKFRGIFAGLAGGNTNDT